MVLVVGVDHAPATAFATEAYTLSPGPPISHMSLATHSPLSSSLPDAIMQVSTESEQNLFDSGSGLCESPEHTHHWWHFRTHAFGHPWSESSKHIFKSGKVEWGRAARGSRSSVGHEKEAIWCRTSGHPQKQGKSSKNIPSPFPNIRLPLKHPLTTTCLLSFFSVALYLRH